MALTSRLSVSFDDGKEFTVIAGTAPSGANTVTFTGDGVETTTAFVTDGRFAGMVAHCINPNHRNGSSLRRARRRTAVGGITRPRRARRSPSKLAGTHCPTDTLSLDSAGSEHPRTAKHPSLRTGSRLSSRPLVWSAAHIAPRYGAHGQVTRGHFTQSGMTCKRPRLTCRVAQRQRGRTRQRRRGHGAIDRRRTTSRCPLVRPRQRSRRRPAHSGDAWSVRHCRVLGPRAAFAPRGRQASRRSPRVDPQARYASAARSSSAAAG